eukprot:TRINITY_DN26705_c0_g1_i1.p1 TRINITY_DN26705_c0_g1~~TRINITY_DN26705_c0_g1_i1.p1  ORF type:complete len:111 (-),score=38.71 TRINITY_DN26705_c0_g1_i1:327-659(-)
MLVLLVFLSQFMMTIPMELGKSGVYDSPLATDELVRKFGFLFGGGRSGVKGIEAFQDHNDPMPHSPPPLVSKDVNLYHVKEKGIVELSPLMVENTNTRKPKMFSRFMAVP